jgi:hypothetical protein
MGEMKITYIFFVRNTDEERPVGGPKPRSEKILKSILKL